MRINIIFWVAACLLLHLVAQSAWAQGPTLDLSFTMTTAVGHRRPAIYPYIVDMVLQPDGKLIVAGDFSSLNGRPVYDLARLLPNGEVDTTFTAPPFDAAITSIALQADGRLLVGGRFTTIDGQSRLGIARLRTNGALDPSFLSPLGITPSAPVFYSYVEKVVVQPGKGILLLGTMLPQGGNGTGSFYAARLNEATGALDSTFQPAFDTFDTRDVLVLPNGHLIFSGGPHTLGGQDCSVWSTLPDGALDSSFVPLPSPPATIGIPIAYGLARESATAKLYVIIGPTSTGAAYEPVRLLPNGVPDASFSLAGVFPTAAVSAVSCVVVQPNGRILLGGDLPTGTGTYLGSARLLPSGALDPSYNPNNGPYGSNGVRKVLIQPDGALLFCGVFTQAGGFALNCLARMLDPHVLSAKAPAQVDDDVVAWPVPAREVLHLRLPAARPGRELTLLDGLGRVVRQQTVPAGQPTPDLSTAGLPPGGYLLRVRFAQGPPAYRRVAVE